jgi:hypothetical protein
MIERMAGRERFEPAWKSRITRFYPRRRMVDFVLLVAGRYCAVFFVSIPLSVFAFAVLDMDGHDRHAEPVRSFLYQSLRLWVGVGSYAFALCFCIGAIVFLSSQQVPGGMAKRDADRIARPRGGASMPLLGAPR